MKPPFDNAHGERTNSTLLKISCPHWCGEVCFSCLLRYRSTGKLGYKVGGRSRSAKNHASPALLMTGKGRIFSNTSNLLNDLLSALTGGVISNSHSLYNTTDNNPSSVLSGDLPQFFTNDENTSYTTAAPKAFLNWVAFDNQLNLPTRTGRHERCQLRRGTSTNYYWY